MSDGLRYARLPIRRFGLLTLVVVLLVVAVVSMSAAQTGTVLHSASGTHTISQGAGCKYCVFDPGSLSRGGRHRRSTGFLLPGPEVAVVVLALVASLLLWKTRREESDEERDTINDKTTPRKVRLRPSNPREAVLAAFSDVEERLASHGVSREDWEPPESYLARAMPEAWRNGRMANTLARLYALARYSHHPVDATSAAQAIEASRGLIALLDRASAL